MAYTKTNWVNNETSVSASKMNKIENELLYLDTQLSQAKNADTLDGFHASSFVKTTDFSTGKATTDWNSITKSGFYYDSTSTSNKPSSDNYVGIVTVGISNTTEVLMNTNTQKVFSRIKTGSTWSAWTPLTVQEAVHANDADTVGGHRIFVQGEEPQNPKTGDLWIW